MLNNFLFINLILLIMEKDFLTITPSSGSGSQEVTVVASANTGEARSTSIIVSGGSMTRTVDANQESQPLNQVGDYNLDIGFFRKSGEIFNFATVDQGGSYPFEKDSNGYVLNVDNWMEGSTLEDVNGLSFDASEILFKWDTNQNILSVSIKEYFTGAISEAKNIIVSGNMGNNKFENYILEFEVSFDSQSYSMKLRIDGYKV